jgi:RHS repeat-associated protein
LHKLWKENLSLLSGLKKVIVGAVSGVLVFSGVPSIAFAETVPWTASGLTVTPSPENSGEYIGDEPGQVFKVATGDALTTYTKYRISLFDITNLDGSTPARLVGDCEVTKNQKFCEVWQNDYTTTATPGTYRFQAVLEGTNDGSFNSDASLGLEAISSHIQKSNAFLWERKPFVLSAISKSLFVSTDLSGPSEESYPTIDYSINQSVYLGKDYSYYLFEVEQDRLIAKGAAMGGINSSFFDIPRSDDDTNTYQIILAENSDTVDSQEDLTGAIASSIEIRKTRREWSVTISPLADIGLAVDTKVGGGNYAVYLEDKSTGEIFWTSQTVGSSWDDGYRGHPVRSTDWAIAYVARPWDTDNGTAPTSKSQLKDIIADSENLKDKVVGPGMTSSEESDAGWNPTELCQQKCSGDPINNYTGEFFESKEDMTTVGTLLKPTMTRHFSTRLKDEFNSLGYGWRNSYEMKIQSNSTDPIASAKTIKLVNENGSKSFFYRNDDGTYSAPGRVKATLSRNATTGEFTLFRSKKDTFIFGSDGKLKSIKNLNGNVISLSYYTSGRLYRASDVRGNTLTFVYNADGTLATVTDQNARKTTYSYTLQQLTSITDPKGVITKYTYDENRRVATLTNPIGGITKNFYDAENRVVKQNDPIDTSLLFEYSGTEDHQETTITHPNGYIMKEVYSSGMLVKRVENSDTPLAREWNYSYDLSNNMTGVVNPDGSFTSSKYDANDNLVKSVNELGGVSTFTYDSKGNVLTVTNPLGKVYSYTYDSRGNLTSETTPLGNKRTMTWNANGTLQNTVEPRGNKLGTLPADFTTSIGYDTRSLPTSSIAPMGVKTSTEYDAFGRPSKMIAPKGLVTGANPDDYATGISYNTLDLPATVTNPKAANSSFTYNKLGDIATSTDAQGNVTTNSYAIRGNLIQVKDALGNIEKYSHDTSLRTVSYTDKRGKITRYYYDALGRMTSTKDPLAQVTTFAYDNMDRAIEVTDAEGKKTKKRYDPMGNLTAETDALGNTSRAVYNNAGQIVYLLDSEGKKTSYVYDNDGNLIETANPDGMKVKTVYDAAGNLVSRTNSGGKTETWTYDALNRKVSHTNAENKTETYEYDVNSNLIKTTRRDGTIVSATYDSTDLNTGIDYPGNDSDISYAYDSLGRTVTETNPVSTTTTTYDVLSRITSKGTPNNITSYAYDVVGNNTSLTYPSGRIVTYAYNDANKMASLTTTGLGTVSFGYDKRNLPVSSALPNGLTETRSIDALGRQSGLTVKNAVTGSEIYKNTKKYTPASNLESSTVTVGTSAPVIENYTHDVMNRTTKNVSGVPDASADYGYNTAGVLTSLGTKTITVDNIGKPLSVGTKMLGYDAIGNRTSETTPNIPTRNLTWKLDNTLASVTDVGTTSTSYTYDANGLILSRISGTEEDKFTWDTLAENALMLSDGDFEYIYGPNHVPLAQLEGSTSTVHYIHADQNGSVIAVTNASGVLANQPNYSTYGERIGNSSTRFGFAGEWTDEVTKYSFLRARWYDAKTGSFLAEDPIVQITGEAYGYVSGNPLTRIDPSGLFDISGAMSRWASDLFIAGRAEHQRFFSSSSLSFLDSKETQRFTNGYSGFWDVLSSGSIINSESVRQWMGTDYLVDSCSPDYALGGMGGAVAGMVGPGGPAKGAMFAMKGAKAATSITRGQLAVPAFLQAIAAADMVDNGQTLMKHFKNYVNS